MAETYKKVAGQTGDDAPEDYKDVRIEVTEVPLKHETTCRTLEIELDNLNEDLVRYNKKIELAEAKKVVLTARLAGAKGKAE